MRAGCEEIAETTQWRRSQARRPRRFGPLGDRRPTVSNVSWLDGFIVGEQDRADCRGAGADPAGDALKTVTA